MTYASVTYDQQERALQWAQIPSDISGDDGVRLYWDAQLYWFGVILVQLELA